MGTFSHSIRSFDDQALVALLTRRPDLASPSPANLVSLAARASNGASLSRALASLNASALEILESVFILHSLGRGTSEADLRSAVLGDGREGHEGREDSTGVNGDSSDAAQFRAELSTLTSLALLWWDEDQLRLAPGLEDLFETFPAGFGPLSSNAVATDPLPASAPEYSRTVLNAVLWGPPVARVPANLLSTHAAANEPPTNEALRWLLHNAYLELLDSSHVYIPRQTAFALRQGRTHRGLSLPPLTGHAASLTPESIQSEAARAATESVRLVTELIALWERDPAQSLRNGGLPVRELKRVANSLDLTSEDAVLVCELALASRLVRTSDDAAKDFSPTVSADDWLALDVEHRWSQLVQGWLVSQRMPWRIGQLDERASTINALHPEVHEAWVPRLRNNVLSVLREHPLAPMTPELVLAELRWHAPRAAITPESVAGLFREAEFLGLTGAGALLPGTDDGLAAALANALPEPVGEIFVQGDLTGMVPGRPTPPLEALLELCAVVESRGGALTVRFTPESITRAFDEGMGAAEIIDELGMYSVTPLPQPLTYLIADVARKHGNVRVGAMSSYIRIHDEAAAAAILSLPAFASVGIFEIAPTVLGASAPITTVLQLLREAGMAPVVESPDGQVITADRQSEKTRVSTRSIRSHLDVNLGVSTPFPGDDALGKVTYLGTRKAPLGADSAPLAVVAQLRAEHEATPTPSPTPPHDGVTGGGTPGESSKISDSSPDQGDEPSLTIVLLREAIADGSLVTIAMADSRGTLTHRTLKPLRLDSGRLRAADPARESELTVAIHRIASVTRLNQPHTTEPPAGN
ncbi:helicase-associated domain-containing protein [Timonella senegalensis]|uniref:helicase-associated domain-containing protein n=1 Tax=Timonella senegalensis TaxID=1465825 RepID=UPI0002F30D70|nr:helicase-associated domain-containing protein [Timonella senegalensis]